MTWATCCQACQQPVLFWQNLKQLIFRWNQSRFKLTIGPWTNQRTVRFCCPNMSQSISMSISQAKNGRMVVPRWCRSESTRVTYRNLPLMCCRWNKGYMNQVSLHTCSITPISDKHCNMWHKFQWVQSCAKQKTVPLLSFYPLYHP